MIYGQWWGRTEGDNKGEILMNIDKCKAGQLGSISFTPDKGTDAFPLISKIHFSKCAADNVEATLDSFVGFGLDGKLVFPHKNKDSELSSKGNLSARLSHDRTVIEGTWGTELGYKGTIKLQNLGSWVTGEEIRQISWKDFKTQITNSTKFPFGLFYRGQSNSSHVLKTAFHRKYCWDLYRFHTEIMNELMENMSITNNMKYSWSNPDDLPTALLLAQHHGFPTPLLDWTISPYVAAYFAFREVSFKDLPKFVRVYIFNAEKWLLDFPEHNQGGVVSPGVIIKPLKISMVGNKRAIIQNSRSLFSNIEHVEVFLKIKGKEKQPEPYLNWFDFSIDEMDAILHDLRLMNITEYSLFPDIEGVCRILNKKYFVD